MTHDDYDDEDVPCFMLTVQIPVTAWDIERATEYLKEVLYSAKRSEEREIWDHDVTDWEVA